MMTLGNFAKGLQHIGLPTNHMDTTIAFYEGLGFTKKYETLNEKAGERVVFLELKGLVIEAYENGRAALQSGAIDHIAIDVENVEAAYRLAQEQGYEIVSNGIEALPFWEKGVRFFLILGPNQERIEFNEIL
ncbi:VOC family protein [Acutalibacter sp.]|jgi:lactoylglutathione lyase|uniref:VOC family protein n=1 Tax=Acutalibacter sp. TaxID=1918636 RepID=UPI0034DE9D19